MEPFRVNGKVEMKRCPFHFRVHRLDSDICLTVASSSLFQFIGWSAQLLQLGPLAAIRGKLTHLDNIRTYIHTRV